VERSRGFIMSPMVERDRSTCSYLEGLEVDGEERALSSLTTSS
jgi:hypothetical protein